MNTPRGARFHWRRLDDLQELCFKFSVRYPIEYDRKQILARLTDSAWWLRSLRVSHANKAEGAAIDAGIVNKRADVYCSTDTLQRRTSQRKRNAETLAGIKMVNTATGEVMSLADIAKGGTGNHENRRAELVTRVRALKNWQTNTVTQPNSLQLHACHACTQH